jgi:hypothetical protein
MREIGSFLTVAPHSLKCLRVSACREWLVQHVEVNVFGAELLQAASQLALDVGVAKDLGGYKELGSWDTRLLDCKAQLCLILVVYLRSVHFGKSDVLGIVHFPLPPRVVNGVLHCAPSRWR